MNTRSIGKTIRVGFASLVAGLVLAAALGGCGGARDGDAAAAGPPVKVQVVAAAMQRTPEVQELVGTVRVKNAATVAAQVMSRVEQVLVTAGDTVVAGQLLAALDARELRAQFDQAAADHQRLGALLAQQAATQAEFDAVQARYLAAQAALSHAEIVAPFDGMVVNKLVEPGDLATPGQPLFLVEDPRAYRLEAEVPERFVDKVKLGSDWHVRIDASGERCVGQPVELVRVVDPASRSFTVKIDLTCRQPLQSGMFGRAELILGERFGMFVPTEAIHQRGQLTFVHVAVDGQARLRLVRVGKRYLGATELLAGLESGEQVITAAEGELTDGTPVAF